MLYAIYMGQQNAQAGGVYTALRAWAHGLETVTAKSTTTGRCNHNVIELIRRTGTLSQSFTCAPMSPGKVTMDIRTLGMLPKQKRAQGPNHYDFASLLEAAVPAALLRPGVTLLNNSPTGEARQFCTAHVGSHAASADVLGKGSLLQWGSSALTRTVEEEPNLWLWRVMESGVYQSARVAPSSMATPGDRRPCCGMERQL